MIELCCEYLSVPCNWLYVLVMSRTCFKVNPSYDDLKKINGWACKWKMSFNLDSTKPMKLTKKLSSVEKKYSLPSDFI